MNNTKNKLCVGIVLFVILLFAGCVSKSDIALVEAEKARIAAEMLAGKQTETPSDSERLVWRHPKYQFAFFISPEITVETVSENEIYFNKASGEPVGSLEISDFSSYEITNNKDALPDKVAGSTINDITIDGEPGIIVREINQKDPSYESEQLITISPDHKLQLILSSNGRAKDFLSDTMNSWSWR